jgi:hypothetical protein
VEEGLVGGQGVTTQLEEGGHARALDPHDGIAIALPRIAHGLKAQV